MEQKKKTLSKSLTITVDNVVVGFVNIATTLPETTQDALHNAEAMTDVLKAAVLTVRQEKPESSVLNDIVNTAAIREEEKKLNANK